MIQETADTVEVEHLLDDHCSTQEGGYLQSQDVPFDGWGHEFVYMVPGPNGAPYQIFSYGADGEPGGSGENADITSADR